MNCKLPDRFYRPLLCFLALILLLSAQVQGRNKKNKKKETGITKEQLKKFDEMYRDYTFEVGGRRDPFVCPVQREPEKEPKNKQGKSEKISGEKTPAPPKTLDADKFKAIYTKAMAEAEKLRKQKNFDKAETILADALKQIKPMDETMKWRKDLEEKLAAVKREKAEWEKFNTTVDNLQITGRIISENRSVGIINGKCLLEGSRIKGVELNNLILEKLTKEEAVFRYKDLTKNVKFKE